MNTTCPYFTIVADHNVCLHCLQHVQQLTDTVCNANCPLIKQPDKFPCSTPKPAPTVEQLQIAPTASQSPVQATTPAKGIETPNQADAIKITTKKACNKCGGAKASPAQVAEFKRRQAIEMKRRNKK